MDVNNLATIGLNQDDQFQDLTRANLHLISSCRALMFYSSIVFVTAAGFASASALYKLDDPPFVFDEYTVAPFQVPFQYEIRWNDYG
jgi:hypothetical protein